jgi:hypothetical protein
VPRQQALLLRRANSAGGRLIDQDQPHDTASGLDWRNRERRKDVGCANDVKTLLDELRAHQHPQLVIRQHDQDRGSHC